MTVVSATVFAQFAQRPTRLHSCHDGRSISDPVRLFTHRSLYQPHALPGRVTTGIGCILILQLEPLMGHMTPPNVVNVLTALPQDVVTINWRAAGVGLLSLAICLWWPKRLTRIVPSPLLALIICTVVTVYVADVPMIGEVPSGMPTLQFPQVEFEQLSYMLVSALVLAALGSIDSLLTSLVADNISRSFHDSDKELVGQGIGNLLAGFAGGLPGAGATVRTLANFKAGGRTPLSGVLHALILLLIVLGLGPVVSVVPHAALAGITSQGRNRRHRLALHQAMASCAKERSSS